MTQRKEVLHYTCKVCGQEFDVPYYVGESNTPPEMFVVIEHEESHTENGQEPDWSLNIVEESVRKEEHDG